MCNRNCSNCPYCNIEYVDDFLIPENQPKDKEIENPFNETIEEEIPVEENGLVPVANVDRYEVTKNIFGKEVVKKVK